MGTYLIVSGWGADQADVASSPVFEDRSPAPDSTGVAIESHIEVQISDALETIDAAATVAVVDGTTVWTGGGPASGWSGIATQLGPRQWRYEFVPPAPLPSAQLVTVAFHAANDAYGTLDGYWSFQTMPPGPFLLNRNPADMVSGLDPAVPVSVDVLDDAGVVASSLRVYVMGLLAYDGYSFIAPFSGTVSPTTVDAFDGYHISMSSASTFPRSSWIAVRVLATDVDNLPLDETWQFRINTVLSSLGQGPYEIALDVGFSGPMLLSSLLDASLYRLSGGAYVRLAEPLPPSGVPTGVRLWVEGFRGTQTFTLTISPLVRDVTGDMLALDGQSASIAPQSTAFLSNTGGLVRSWHESRLILRDGLRTYLANIRGMDVFDIEHGLERPVRWAQILDSYGTGAVCILGTADYRFSDTTPPILANRHPAPGDIGVPIGTTVSLSVADEDTAVEVTSIAVYLNGHLAFGGAVGWSSGFGGQITVRHQILDIFLYPPVGAVVVGANTVSVLASDLVGNVLNTSYQFEVGAPPPTMEGFGTGPFGESSFGG